MLIRKARTFYHVPKERKLYLKLEKKVQLEEYSMDRYFDQLHETLAVNDLMKPGELLT